MRSKALKINNTSSIKSVLVFSDLVNLFFKISSYTISLLALNLQIFRSSVAYFKRRTGKFRSSLFKRRFPLF